MKPTEIKFTKLEIMYLLEIVFRNMDEGKYWGRKDYFFKRQSRVARKLREAIGY